MTVRTVYTISTDRYLLEHLKGIANEDFILRSEQELKAFTSLPPDQLVIVDVDVIHWHDDEWQRFFQQQLVLVASLKPTDAEGQRAFVLGAKAYVPAYSLIQQWRHILTHVADGQVWLGASLLSRLLSQLGAQQQGAAHHWQQELTRREIDVAQRAALGHSNQQIAQDLNITERTVRAHLGSVFAKLKVNDRLSLALTIHGLK